MTKSKKKKIMVLGLIALFLFVCLICIVGIIWAVAIGIISMLFLLLNLYAKNKIAWNAEHLFSDIGRNYDYLLIGEPWNSDELKGKKLCFFSPNRSMLSSYELGRRLFSLLNEGTGTMVISCREGQLDSKTISVLDIPYLHETQQHKYGITHGKLKTYLPFVFAPLESLRYFLSPKREKVADVSLSEYALFTEFCKVRNIKLLIIKTK